MAIKTYYLYNTTASEVTLGDIGLRIGAGENYQFDSNEIADNLLKDGGDLEASINAGDLVLTEDATIPPATQYSIQMALAILSLETLAEEVTFDNSTSGGLTSTNLQDAVIEISTGAVTSSPLFFDAYTTSEDNITSGWTDVPLNVEREKDADGFTHATDSPEVTINKDFRYLIIARVGVFQNGGNSRSNAQFRLSLDTGSGFSPVAGSLGDIYSRSNAQGEGNGVVALVLDLNDGDKIKIQARREDGGGTIFLKSEACSLTMSQLKGEKGVKGDQGPPGTQGINVLDDGTQVNTSFAVDVNFTGDPISSITETTPGEVEVALQSRISVKGNDALVVNTPHSIINFKGNGVEATDAGSNQVDITIETEFGRYVKNILLNTLEIESLKNSNVNDEFTYFVDTFENGGEIDPSSTSYNVNETEGFIELNQGGALEIIDTTKDQFDMGTFTNTESFQEIGGNGSIRKERTVTGALTILEDFEDTTNVSGQTRTDIHVADFEDNTLNGWTITISGGNTGLEDNSSVIGEYGLRVEANGRISSPVFNCSTFQNVKIRFYAAGDSLDDPDEELKIGWYDGTSWQLIQTVENNQSGYFDIDIPNSWLASNNQIILDLTDDGTLLSGNNTNGDNGYFDDVEVYYLSESQLQKTSNAFIVYNGTYSGQYNVDFANKEYNGIQIDLGSSGVDISLAKFLKLHLFKGGDGDYQYKIKLIDTNEDVWESGLQNFTTSQEWELYQTLISGITGIDKTAVEFVQVEFVEDTTGSIVLELSDPPSTDTFTLVANREVRQTFEVTSTATVQRIQMWFQTRNNQPRVPLYVGLANVFETTLATATFVGSQTSPQTYGPIIPATTTFNNPVTLIAGQKYTLLLKTFEENWSYAWQYQKSDVGYTDGTYYEFGNPQTDDIMFTLYTPQANETVYFDDLEIESESTYESTGSFLSRAINLGVTPDTFDEISFVEEGTEDDIEVRVRASSTEAGLTSATWSSWFSGPGPHDIGTITPQQWFQYELRWINGGSTDTSVVSSVTIDYSLTGPGGSATVISAVENTSSAPSKFIMLWEDAKGTGSINYSISRNNKVNWQSVPEINKGQLTDFTVASGTQIHIRADITGNAKLYSWGVACDEEFI